MNARLLKIVAALLALGAVIAAVVGIRLSSGPAEKPAAAPATFPAVVARITLTAGRPIAANDVVVQALTAKPSRGFAAVQDVVGKVPQVDVAAGEPLVATHFATGGALARQVRPGERAVAVKVDDVIGLGGFAQPGDRLDVLLYLRGDRETDNKSSAQVVLRDVRLLAFVDVVQTPPAASGEEEQEAKRAATKETLSKVGLGADKEARRQRTLQSAVLAVPEADAPKLMLAASTGTLRLALRPAAGVAAPAPVPAAGNNELIRLGELVRTEAPRRAAPATPAGPGIVVYEGDRVRGGSRGSRNE